MNNRVLNRITGVLDVLEVFEDRVVLTPRGVQGRLVHGLASRSFYFAALNATRYVPATLLLSGLLSFDAEPVSEDLSRMRTDGKRKNVFVFSGPDKNQWLAETRQYIDSRIQACGHGAAVASHVETARSTYSSHTVERGMTTVTQTSSYQTGNGQVYSTTTTSTSSHTRDGYADASQAAERPEGGYLARIQFNYKSLEGGVTPCLVSVSNVSAVRFEGYCHRTQTERSFLIARVSGAVFDQETGERTQADFYFAELLLRMPMLLAKRAMPQMAEVREAQQEHAQARKEIKTVAEQAGFSSRSKAD